MDERERYFSELRAHRDQILAELDGWDFNEQSVGESRTFITRTIVKIDILFEHHSHRSIEIPKESVPDDIAMFLPPYHMNEVRISLGTTEPRWGYSEAYRWEPSARSHISIEFGIADSGLDFLVYDSEALAMVYGNRGQTEGVSRFLRTHGNDEKFLLATMGKLCRGVMVNDLWLAIKS